MAKIQGLPDLSNVSPDMYVRYSSQAIKTTVDTVNGNLQFDQNLATQTITVMFPQALTDVSISHVLNKNPVLYIVGSKSGPCDIFTGVGTPTASRLWLQSTVAGVTVTLILS